MAAEIRLAGFTLTSDEWDVIDPETRAELASEAHAGAELDDELLDGADVLW